MSTADPQRAGLALGTPVRSARAEIKRQIKAGRLDAAALIAGELDGNVEQTALGMRVGELVAAVPGVTGNRTIAVAIAAELLTLDRRLGELTIRQRTALAEAIREETDR